MSEMFEKASKTLQEEMGQDKIMALATRNKDGVAARTVNVYTYKGDFYFITETDSNKYAQIRANDQVALSVDAIQITGHAIALEHPCAESNRQIASFIEKQLPQQFARYASNSAMRLIKITPVHVSFILLKSGEGYRIDYLENTAIPIRHEM